MISGLTHPLQSAAREAAQAARAALWRAALVGAALLIATVGAGFLLFAGFAALRIVLGPALAALVIGAVLVLLAGILVLIARRPGPARHPVAPPAQEPKTGPAEAATLAVFTAAFVLGRVLATGRRR